MTAPRSSSDRCFRNPSASSAQAARSRNVPVIAFSTDANVASNGVYLLSFLPESDVDRIVQYASSVGKRSYAALIPDNPYGTVVEAAFKQAIARRRAARSSRSSAIRTTRPPWRRRSATSPRRSARADCAVHSRQRRCGAGRGPGAGRAMPSISSGCSYSAPVCGTTRAFLRRRRSPAAGTRRRTAPATGVSPRATAALQSGSGADRDAVLRCRRFDRRFGEDAGPQAFSPQVLTNPSGFAGIDGLFRFKPDGTNERGLAVLRVATSGAQMLAPAPRSFTGSAAG